MKSSSSVPTTPAMMIDDEAFPNIPISEMSNEELADTSTIHGWDLIHSPPKKLPRGALIGTVVSDKMNKTVNVAVVRYRTVRKIRKRMRYTRKFMAHDEKEIANMGDTVMITPCHRLSKCKHFMLREIIRPKGQL
jgi:small subunit ribosomal protein S17